MVDKVTTSSGRIPQHILLATLRKQKASRDAAHLITSITSKTTEARKRELPKCIAQPAMAQPATS